MKILLPLIQLLAVFSCQPKHEIINVPKLSENSDSTVILRKIYSDNTISSSSLIAQPDSLFIITPSEFKTQKTNVIKKIYFDSVKKIFVSKKLIEVPYVIPETSFVKSEGKIFLETLTASVNQNTIISVKLKKQLAEHNLEIKNIWVQKSNSKIYIIDKEFPKLRIYDETKDDFKTYEFGEIFNEVINFFIYDITNDGSPELFIFHIGSIARDNAVSYEIFSLQ